MIRLATKEDFNLVSEFTQRLIEESSYGKFFKGYELTEFMFSQYTDHPREKLCVIIGDNQGFAMFDTMVWPHIDKEVKYARLPFIYIVPDARKTGLMDDVILALEYWAKQIGCAYCVLGTKTKKKGYKKAETVYMKELK